MWGCMCAFTHICPCSYGECVSMQKPAKRNTYLCISMSVHTCGCGAAPKARLGLQLTWDPSLAATCCHAHPQCRMTPVFPFRASTSPSPGLYSLPNTSRRQHACYYLFLQDKKLRSRTSLVFQWLRIQLPVQGTWVQSLVREDPTCLGATKPVCHNYRAQILEPVLQNKRSHRNEKSTCHN